MFRLRAGRNIDPNNSRVLILDKPDSSVGCHRHSDRGSLRPYSVHLMPLRNQFGERRRRHLRLFLSLKIPRRLGCATDTISHRRWADHRNALPIAVLEDYPATRRPITVQTDDEFPVELGKPSTVVVE